MARPKKPIDAKIAQGTSRKHRDAGKQNPKGKTITKPVRPPSDLDAIGREKFNSLQATLIDMRIFTPIDVENLYLASLAYSDYVKTKAYIVKHFKSIEEYLSGATTQTSQLYNRMVKSLDAYQKILSKYGGSPTDRSKIVIPKEKEKNPVESFLEGA